MLKRIVGVVGLVVIVGVNPICMWLVCKDPGVYQGSLLYTTAWIWGAFLWLMFVVVLVLIAGIGLIHGVCSLWLLLARWASGE
jgi:hypothetical protein